MVQWLRLPCSQCTASPPHGGARGWGRLILKGGNRSSENPDTTESSASASLGWDLREWPQQMRAPCTLDPGWQALCLSPHLILTTALMLRTCPSSQLVQGQAGIEPRPSGYRARVPEGLEDPEGLGSHILLKQLVFS